MNKLISIVIPVYKEAEHLENSIKVIISEVIKTGLPYEMILIDDGSSDSTWEIIENLSKQIPQINAFRLSRNFGKESALCAGLEHARGDAVIVMDCDLQHPPQLLPKMVNLWKHNEIDVVDCIKTSRGKESLVNKLGAKIFYTILNKISGYNLDGASDFKLLDRKVVDSWKNMGDKNLFFRGMSEWLGFKREKISFEVAERTTGQSAWSLFKLTRLAITALVAFSAVPLRLVTVLGMLFLIASFILGIHTIYMKISGLAVTGFTTVILLILICGSILMISLGMIGEYIAAIYNEVKGRPRYIIQQKIGGHYGN